MTDMESNIKQLMAMDSCWLLAPVGKVSNVSIISYNVITFYEEDASHSRIIVTYRRSPIRPPQKLFLPSGAYDFFATKEEAEQEVVLRKLTGREGIVKPKFNKVFRK